MDSKKIKSLLKLDAAMVWHPYSAIGSGQPVFPVESAKGVRIRLADGRELIDGMSSWWSAIHGYNHPVINHAIDRQMLDMAHVMFGGLTHRPAVELALRLVNLTPETLKTVFFSDSGSVAVEVAMKMALQYWHGKKQMRKTRFLSLRQGYHGDTFGAMSVCDPDAGMHRLFSGALSKQLFANTPQCGFDEPCADSDIEPLLIQLRANQYQLAAVILEPIVQGAGGMHFYSADYLRRVRELCDRYNVLLITDEIATGFGRTVKCSPVNTLESSPILCVWARP